MHEELGLVDEVSLLVMEWERALVVLPDWLLGARDETQPVAYPWREVGEFLEVMAGDVGVVEGMDRLERSIGQGT